MIRHTVLFRWAADATEADKRRVLTEIGRLPGLVPSVRSFGFGTDLGINAGNYDLAVSAVFDDEAGYLEYRDNPDHRAMIRDVIAPAIAERAAVQFQD